MRTDEPCRAAPANRLKSAALASRAAHRVVVTSSRNATAAAAKGARKKIRRSYRWKSRPDQPGGYAAEPGIDPHKAQPDLEESEKWNRRVFVDVVEYGPDRVEFRTLDNDDIKEFLAGPKPEWAKVRWINVNVRTHVVVW